MMQSFRALGLAIGIVLLASAVNAQTGSSSTDTDTRPATTTATGDTGLWYVPTAEVLTQGKWSASGYRTSFNYAPGFSNVADFPLTFAFGVLKQTEVFASWKAVTRIDRDLRPIFVPTSPSGGVISQYPYSWNYWTGSKVGDLTVGVKFNVLSEHQGKPLAVAVRGGVKLPTGDRDAGVSTGKVDGFVDVVASKDILRLVEISGYGGGAFRTNPSDVSQSNGVRWGIGGAVPSHFPLRLTAELNGEHYSKDTITVSTPIIGADQSVALGTYPIKDFQATTIGLTFQMPKGFFVGAAVTKTFNAQSRSGFRADSDPSVDYADLQVRVGFHPGVRRYVPPPPPAPPAPAPPPPPPANRPPTFTGPGGGITANPTEVPPGGTVNLTARAQDADGDTLTYRWTAPQGTFSNPNSPTTTWTAPNNFEGTVPLTVTADDGKGGTASATTNITVRRPPAPIVQLNFEDVYFDFDRSTLRPEALRLLDDAVAKLNANPDKQLIIEGHTCNIGTAEYNLALGDRRARSVQNYLVSRGISANRLEIRSYGEEQPKYDNSREETRRLNRRAALVVKVQ